jgi:hypothetical protein
MGGKIAECGAEGALALGIDILKVLETISIGAIHCFFANSENHKYLKYLILLTAGSSKRGVKIAECGPEGAQPIGINIQTFSTTMNIADTLCFFGNCEYRQYLKYLIILILLLSGSSKRNGNISGNVSEGASDIGTDIHNVLATTSIG